MLFKGVTIGTKAAHYFKIMEKAELIIRLQELVDDSPDMPIESNHIHADELLLDFINDIEIKEVYNEIPKWHA